MVWGSSPRNLRLGAIEAPRRDLVSDGNAKAEALAYLRV